MTGKGSSEVEATSSISSSWFSADSDESSDSSSSNQSSADNDSLLPSNNSFLVLRSWLSLSLVLEPFPSLNDTIDVSLTTSDDSDSVNLSSHYSLGSLRDLCLGDDSSVVEDLSSEYSDGSLSLGSGDSSSNNSSSIHSSSSDDSSASLSSDNSSSSNESWSDLSSDNSSSSKNLSSNNSSLFSFDLSKLSSKNSDSIVLVLDNSSIHNSSCDNSSSENSGDSSSASNHSSASYDSSASRNLSLIADNLSGKYSLLSWSLLDLGSPSSDSEGASSDISSYKSMSSLNDSESKNSSSDNSLLRLGSIDEFVLLNLNLVSVSSNNSGANSS